MKNITHINTLLSIALVAIGMAGCTEKAPVELGLIGFEPVVKVETVSRGVGDNIYSKEKRFGVWVMGLDEELSWSRDHSLAIAMATNEPVGWNGSQWCTESEIMWPHKKRITVAACSPAGATASFNATQGVVFEAVDALADGAGELMWAGPVYDQHHSNNAGTINLPFQHALCSVQFVVIPHIPTDMSVKIKRISMEGLRHVGTFNSLPEPLWIPSGESCTVEFFEGSQEVGPAESAELESQRWLIPQVCRPKVKVECEFVYEGGGGYTQTLETIEPMAWKAGKQYTYTLKVSLQSVGFLHAGLVSEVAGDQ